MLVAKFTSAAVGKGAVRGRDGGQEARDSHDPALETGTRGQNTEQSAGKTASVKAVTENEPPIPTAAPNLRTVVTHERSQT